MNYGWMDVLVIVNSKILCANMADKFELNYICGPIFAVDRIYLCDLKYECKCHKKETIV